MLSELSVYDLHSISNCFLYLNSKMKKILFLDTETTGLPTPNPDGTMAHYTKLENYGRCRLLQVSAILSAETGRQIDYVDNYISLEPFFNDAQHINHITPEIIETMGIPLLKALKELEYLLIQADEVVIQYSDFDRNVILSEINRLKLEYGIDLLPVFAFHLEKAFCTKKFFKNYFDELSLKYKSERGPSLTEIYCNVMETNQLPQNLHDSLTDANMLHQIYFRAKLHERL